MDDNAFFQVQLKSLFPSFSTGKWGDSNLTHRQVLAASCNEAIAVMTAAEKAFRQVEDEADLTLEAKLRKRTELGEQFLGKIEKSQTLIKAKEAAASVLAKFQEKIEAPLRLEEESPRQIAVHVQIRDRLHSMKDDKERLMFLERHVTDGAVQRAVLTAPRWLSGLSEGAYAFVRSQMEKQADPEIVAERDFVQSALAEVERGYRAAQSRITKRAKQPISPRPFRQSPRKPPQRAKEEVA